MTKSCFHEMKNQSIFNCVQNSYLFRNKNVTDIVCWIEKIKQKETLDNRATGQKLNEK